MTDGVTDDIVWLQGRRMPWFNTRLGPEKRKKAYILYIYVLYVLYVIYIVYISYMHIKYLIYCIYIYICRVKSEWYINRTSFTTYIG